MPRRPYKEGQWFLITVPADYRAATSDNRYGAGLIARGKRGWTPFVYVFGPWRQPPDEALLRQLRAGEELFTLRMHDGPIREGLWPVIWTDTAFRRAEWPMPEFGMYMGGDNPAYARTMSDDDPGQFLAEREVDPALAIALPPDSVAAEGVIFPKLADPDSRVFRISDAYQPPPSA
jgi:immunity protein 26 of polymorphic toxin system